MPRMNFLIRATPPDVIRPAAELFDSFVRAAAFALVAYAVGTAKRPDILVGMSRVSFALDISITHPYGDKVRDAAASTQGAAARQRALHKISKYNDFCKAQGHRFVPCILETYGHVDKELQQFLAHVYQWAHRHSLGLEDWTHRALSAMSCAMHEGNALVWERARHEHSQYSLPPHIRSGLGLQVFSSE